MRKLGSTMHVSYAVGSRYPEPDEEPAIDSLGLFIEGTPIYKIWFAPPLECEIACLGGTCTHIGLLPPSQLPGGMPLFVFRSDLQQSFLVRGPLCATHEQVQQWASGDSNIFLFILVERGSQIVRQIRTIGVAEDFREELAEGWLSGGRPLDILQCQKLLAGIDDEGVIAAATLWAYNQDEGEYER